MGILKFLRKTKTDDTQKFVAKPLGNKNKTVDKSANKVTKEAGPFINQKNMSLKEEHIVGFMLGNMKCEHVGHSRIDNSPIFKIPSQTEIPKFLRDMFNFEIVQNLADGSSYNSSACRWEIPEFYVVKVSHKHTL